MIYQRGHQYDYDSWAEAGCDGWGYADILPYFIKAEANQNPQLAKNGMTCLSFINIYLKDVQQSQVNAQL